MHIHPQPRARRSVALLAVLLAAVLALTACRTSPSAAAYVGDGVITGTQLDRAVQAGLADSAVADFYQGRLPEYRQIVLQELIATEVYDAAATRYDVSVSDAVISSRLAAILAAQGTDAATFYNQQAAQGRTEADVREQVRRFVLGEEIAKAAGLDDATSDSALRDLYDQTRAQYAQFQVGLITVADQATADSVLAQLTADPASYDVVAAANPNPNTYPSQSATAEQLAGIADDPSTLQVGQGFTDSLLQTGEITVVFILGITYPVFEDIRPTLEQQANAQIQTAVDGEITSVRDSLDITVNPRYGSFDESGTLVPDDRGVVDVLGGDPPPADPAAN